MSGSPRDEEVETDIVEHNVCIGPDPFCTIRYIYDCMYLGGDEAPELERSMNVSKYKMEFYKTFSPDGPDDFQFHRIRAIRTLPRGIVELQLLQFL